MVKTIVAACGGAVRLISMASCGQFHVRASQECPSRQQSYILQRLRFLGRLLLSFGVLLGHKFAMIWVAVAGVARVSYLLTLTIFSCHRRDAHFLMSFKGENLTTGTHTNLAAFRTFLLAMSVLRKLKGDPSLNTITTDGAVLRPRASS